MAWRAAMGAACFSGLICVSASAWAGCPVDRTMVVDPVELLAGREVAGEEALVVEHEGYAYRFASAENKALFEADPARYRAADGGACGRMGPLSGLGDARRYAVHEGRIWFFASDGCREGFLASPERCIERADAPPGGTEAERAAGLAAVDRMIAWAGGAERIGAMATYRQIRRETVESGGKPWAHEVCVSARFPDRFADRDAWTPDGGEESWWAFVANGERGASASKEKAEPLASERRAAFVRQMARLPVVLMKARVEGSLVAVGAGEAEVDGVACDLVRAHTRGATSTLAIETGTGRPVALRYHGRDGGSSVGEVQRLFTGYAQVGGVTLPVAWTVSIDGEEKAGLAQSLASFEINPALDPEVFVVP